MASPHVAGVAALLAAQRLTAPQIAERLGATAADLGLPGRDTIVGHGRVDAQAAAGA